MTTWSPQQNEAFSVITAWLRMKWSPVFYLAGYAGTGKTTLAVHFADQVDGKVAFAAFTGKAARVMRSKGCKGAQTIHSLIYETEEDPATGEFVTTLRTPFSLDNIALIIIDECSMVDEEMGKDLLSFGRPILVLGDPGQLPPVRGAGYFTSRKPDYMLTEVHRQAAESPILRLATEIREGRFRPRNISVPGLVVCDRTGLDQQLVTGADMVIVGKNDTRMKFNRRFRELRKCAGMPNPGEPVICLRNDRKKRIYNGDIFEVVKRRGTMKSVSLTVEDIDKERPAVKVAVLRQFFENDIEASKLGFNVLRGYQQFTYAYTITCHKSQGSQWSNVCVFNEAFGNTEDRVRWLYTAATRASEHLTLVV